MIQSLLLEPLVLFLGLCILLFEAFLTGANRRHFGHLAIAGLAVVLGLSFCVTAGGTAATGFYKADSAAMFFKQLILLATMIVLVMSVEYPQAILKFIPTTGGGAGLGEFYALPVFACAGLMWMASANDFIMIFVALELVTITFYILVSYLRRSQASLEAGVKYLILGALSTGILVYGITWIFGITGTTNLDEIGQAVAHVAPGHTQALLFGITLVLIALGFKVAAAPFQFWVPDVYQGAATPVTAFLSVASKAAGFIVLIRFVTVILPAPGIGERVGAGIAFLAFCTLLYGNFAALPQTNLKRLLAYSSIAHAGYLLMAVASLRNPAALTAIGVYFGAYLLMTLLAFLVMVIASAHLDGDDISHFNGLGQKSPFLAFALLVAMMSLAGVPLTAGFVGKFLIFMVAIDQHLWWLIGLGAVSVGCGFYYYLKVVRAMWWQPAIGPGLNVTLSPLTRMTVVAAIAGILVLGVFPMPLMSLLNR